MRQHGKFEYLKAKNRPENAFHEKFDEFQNFSIFHHFWWFWELPKLKFEFLARFPARGSSQIDLAWNFKLIQFFLFIWHLCADPGCKLYWLKNPNLDTGPKQNNTSRYLVIRKNSQKWILWLNFAHTSFWRKNFWICHFLENLRLAPHRPGITL